MLKVAKVFGALAGLFLLGACFEDFKSQRQLLPFDDDARKYPAGLFIHGEISGKGGQVSPAFFSCDRVRGNDYTCSIGSRSRRDQQPVPSRFHFEPINPLDWPGNQSAFSHYVFSSIRSEQEGFQYGVGLAHIVNGRFRFGVMQPTETDQGTVFVRDFSQLERLGMELAIRRYSSMDVAEFTNPTEELFIARPQETGDNEFLEQVERVYTRWEQAKDLLR